MCAFVFAAGSTFYGNRVAKDTDSVCRNGRRVAARGVTQAKLDALLFDCDGVLADTERDAHRVAFNLAFKERGFEDVWDEELYGKLLETGGGKERMTVYWNDKGDWPAEVGEDAEKRVEMVKGLHKRKTELFMQLVADGSVPLRPGVKRLVKEARDAGVVVAVCSTSNEKAVQAIVDQLGEDGEGVEVFAGDVVEKKKPAPDIYLLAKERLGVDVDKVCVVEDSFIGLSAARAARMACLVTKSYYTKDEDFSEAMWVVESLEEPRVSVGKLADMVEGSGKGDAGMGDAGMGDAGMGGQKFRRLRRRIGSGYL